MKTTILFSLLIFGSLTFKQQSNHQLDDCPHFDESKGVIFPIEKLIVNLNFQWTNTTGNCEDFEIIQKHLEREIDAYNSKLKQIDSLNQSPKTIKIQYSLIDSKDYAYQYAFGIDSLQEKHVFVNAVCLSKAKHWRDNLILVDDGGSCYFNLNINLTKNKLDRFVVNGWN
jgi:hypothetical protein